MFDAVVQWFKQRTSDEAVLPLHLDPHPLRADFDKFGGILALDLKESDFADIDSTVLQRRRAILRRLGVPERAVMPYYDRCLMTGGTPAPPDPETGEQSRPPIPDRCQVAVVAISLSRPVSAIPEKGNCRDCRVVQYVVLTPSSFRVYKLYVQRRQKQDEEWEVIGRQKINGITS